jgi:aspartyl-tRNA(Asn)/glutamyl-tRNA(Gln) amidotransferase subunit C
LPFFVRVEGRAGQTRALNFAFSNRQGVGSRALAAYRRRRYPRRIMSVTNEQVRHIARLARIAMSDEEIARLAPELNNILGWVEQLGEVNTDGVEPLATVIDQKLRLREDAITDGDIRDQVLANAPEAQHGFFAVPKVIE